MSFSVPDPVKLAQDLIRCPSVTPEDAGAQQVMIDALVPLGFTCETLQYENVTNFFACCGEGRPHFCYAGHTDVVPPGDEKSWRYPPFSAEIDDGRLYGRGAADMKGNNAAFVGAVGRFIGTHGVPKGSISFLITGDEEGPAINGTVKVLEWMAAHGHVPDHTLVGEPSNPKTLGEEIKIGRRGSLNGFITVKGKQGHVAYPHLADNPLPRMAHLLGILSCFEFDQGTDHFPPTNLEITTIDTGNEADNVIPEKATARFNIRFNDLWTAESLDQKLRDILDGAGLPYDLQTGSNAESFITAPGDFTALVCDAVEDVTGRKPEMTTSGGTSDARFIQRYCPVVEFGLVNATIHQVDEYAAVEDIEALTDIYLTVLEKYFGV